MLNKASIMKQRSLSKLLGCGLGLSESRLVNRLRVDRAQDFKRNLTKALLSLAGDAHS